MKNSKKREEIISTGKKLIIEKGYLNTSIEDITKKMGIAKGSFYTYFKSKDEFLLAIISEKISQRHLILNEILEKNISLEETIREFLSNSISFPAKDPESFLLIMNLFRNINLLSKEVSVFILKNTKLGNLGISKILIKYKNQIDLVDDEDIEEYANFIKAFINSFYEKTFDPLLNFSEIGENITFSEIKKYIENIDFEREIAFMTKSVMKLVLK